MDLFEVIRERHSTRSFAGGTVPRDILEKLVDAGRRAPTARNEQPWEFVVVTEPPRLKDLAALTDHGKFIAGAGACIAVLCRQSKYYLEDGCAATENILLGATALGLQSCWVAGDKKPYAAEVLRFLGAPPGYQLVSLLAIGRAAAPEKRAAKRKLDDVLHWERF